MDFRSIPFYTVLFAFFISLFLSPSLTSAGGKATGVASEIQLNELSRKTIIQAALRDFSAYEVMRSFSLKDAFIEELRDPEIRLAALTTLIKKEDFASIPKGKFKMGSPESEEGRYNDEVEHWVSLNAYSIQKLKVTQLTWYLVMGTNPSQFKTPADCPKEDYVEIPRSIPLSLCIQNPVENVSWNEIAEKDDQGEYKKGTFLERVRTLVGMDLRLPTEAEWERAARGNIHIPEDFYRPYYFGDLGENEENLKANAWYSENSEGRTHPVGTKGRNRLGLADMSGNTQDWVQDWYAPYEPSSESDPTINPQGPEKGVTRLFRGGSYDLQAKHLRSSHRFDWRPQGKDPRVGLRLVLEQPELILLPDFFSGDSIRDDQSRNDG